MSKKMFFYVKENVCFCFRARAQRIAGHIEASSVVWTLTDNGKLTNQIAISAQICIKNKANVV